MSAAVYSCPPSWLPWIPDGVRCPRSPAEIEGHSWDLLVLTPDACRSGFQARCGLLLVPGDASEVLRSIHAASVVSYGLSLRDTLTLSSLTQPVLCLQRAVPPLEPMEIPLPGLPESPESLLPLLGLLLLAGRLTPGPR